MADHPAELLEIVLPRRERQILQFFVERRIGTVFHKDRLVAHVYGGDPDGGPDGGGTVIESHVSKLNRKFLKFGWRIKSSRFEGYWLHKLPEQSEPPQSEPAPRPHRHFTPPRITLRKLKRIEARARRG
jgi:hypothetical protein